MSDWSLKKIIKNILGFDFTKTDLTMGGSKVYLVPVVCLKDQDIDVLITQLRFFLEDLYEA